MNPYLQLLKKNEHSADDLPSKPTKGASDGFVGGTLSEAVNFFHASHIAFDASNAAANDGEPEETADFWDGFIDRVNECDRLIHELCDIRGDDQARRDDLICTRKRTAPNNVDSDIKYLCEEIVLLTPTPSLEPQRDCRDCDHHRGRDNNRIRYCINADGAAQQHDSLASAITDCSVAARCRAFQAQAP